jgi:autotransporter family porin
MVGSTIRAKVTIGVTLGTTSGPGVYSSPLTITPTGNISPSAYSATGLGAGYVLNEGTITGGVAIAAGSFNEPGHLGGTGVTLTAGASLTNDGEIAGGAGSQGYPGGDGGGGVYLAAGSSLTNHGAIAGGDGGHDSYQQPGGFLVVGGDGGSGVTLAAGSLTNDGTIVGGGGASGLDAYGVGGDGVILVSGSLANDGVIAGGVGGYFLTSRGRSGTGVTVASGTLLAAAVPAPASPSPLAP